MNILIKGKNQDISNWFLANQEGNKNIKMHEIENIKIILLCSDYNQMKETKSMQPNKCNQVNST